MENYRNLFDVESALKEVNEAFEKVKNMTLNQACEVLNGHISDENLFDFNTKNACATIIFRKGKLQLLNTIDVYDENNSNITISLL